LRRIAQHALTFLDGARVIGMSGGTTVTQFARLLTGFDGLTIVTNALNVATHLVANPQFRVFAAGGEVRSSSQETVGPSAETFLASYNIDVAFIGVDGVHTTGCTTYEPVGARVNSVLHQQAKTTIVLADATKIRRVALAEACPMSEVDVLSPTIVLPRTPSTRFALRAARCSRSDASMKRSHLAQNLRVRCSLLIARCARCNTRPRGNGLGRFAPRPTLHEAVTSVKTFVIGLLCGMAGAVVGALVVGVRLRRHDASTAVILDTLAGGDLSPSAIATLTARYPAAATSLDAIVGRVRGLLTEVEAVRGELHDRWQHVNDMALRMLETSEAGAAQATAIRGSAQSLSGSIRATASATEELSATISEIAAHAEQASTVAAEGTERVVSAERAVAALSEASLSVDEVVKLIGRIAGQTHTLSLNATLEAARAGEAGRGFAVVATGVRDLAVQTASATDTVGVTVRGIQTGAQHAAQEMTEVTRTISQVSANQAAIAAAVEQQNGAANEINRGSTDVAQSASLLVDHLNLLLTTVRATAYSGAEGRTDAAALALLEERLAHAASGFRFEHVERATAAANAAVTRVGSMTRVPHAAIGDELNRWHYSEYWSHSAANLGSEGTDAYSSMPGAVATLRFSGSKVQLYGDSDANHGICAVSIDGAADAEYDLYSPSRMSVCFYESPTLARGEHTLTVRVTDEKHPQSRYLWVSISWADVSD
jgi:methyl-accepting chemotaxis protein